MVTITATKHSLLR